MTGESRVQVLDLTGRKEASLCPFGCSDRVYNLSEYLVAVVEIIPIPLKGLSPRPLKII